MDRLPSRRAGRLGLSLSRAGKRDADIFQAMCQNRPYRKGLDAESIAAFIGKLSQQGRVDEEVAALACACCHEAMQMVRA